MPKEIIDTSVFDEPKKENHLFLIIAIILLSSMVLIPIIYSIYYNKAFNEPKYIFATTIGLPFVQDYSISQKLLAFNNSFDVNNSLILSIFISLVIIKLSIFLLYLGVKWIYNKIPSKTEFGFEQKFIAFIIAFVVFMILQAIFTYFIFGVFNYPFEGLIKMIRGLL